MDWPTNSSLKDHQFQFHVSHTYNAQLPNKLNNTYQAHTTGIKQVFNIIKCRLLQGRMGWLGGLGLCHIARIVNQPFSYASCSIIFRGGVCGNSNPQFYAERFRSLPTRAMLFFNLWRKIGSRPMRRNQGRDPILRHSLKINMALTGRQPK